ncbi:MAG TPA: helical backbone metal receptor [Candidatus Acidoferrales bacterium]|nr:helical backbone metal receptor [Candidatus Acidoferrales bacterium]
MFLAYATGAQAANPRIISLAPSLTEIAYRIGCGGELVADTTFDDYPAPARTLPHVADLITADLERISALSPSVVLALHDQEKEAGPITSQLHVPVRYLPNRDLSDLYVDIAQVGAACGREAQARALAEDLRTRIAALAREAAAYKDRPKVFFLLDLPGFTVGEHSFLDDLIRLAGGTNVAGGINVPYPDVSAEWLLQENPDVIVVAHDTQFGGDVLAQEPWRSLHAVQAGRIVRPPTDDILERDGPRIVDGLEWLIHAIHG